MRQGTKLAVVCCSSCSCTDHSPANSLTCVADLCCIAAVSMSHVKRDATPSLKLLAIAHEPSFWGLHLQCFPTPSPFSCKVAIMCAAFLCCVVHSRALNGLTHAAARIRTAFASLAYAQQFLNSSTPQRHRAVIPVLVSLLQSSADHVSLQKMQKPQISSLAQLQYSGASDFVLSF